MKAFVELLTSWGPFGLLFLAALDSAGIPLPAAVDALLIATAAVNPKSAVLGATLAIAGSLAGSMILFYLARKGGQAYLDRATRSGKAQAFREWFQTYGLITVFIPALLPIPMPLKIFVLSAGAMGVRPHVFFGVMLAARVPRYFGLAYLGSQLGPNSVPWLKQHVWELVMVAVVIAALLGLLARTLPRPAADSAPGEQA